MSLGYLQSARENTSPQLPPLLTGPLTIIGKMDLQTPAQPAGVWSETAEIWPFHQKPSETTINTIIVDQFYGYFKRLVTDFIRFNDTIDES